MLRGRGDNILMGEVVKEKVGELEDEVKEVFYRRPRKEVTGVVQGVSCKKMFFVRFWYGFEKDLTSNQLTAMTVDSIPATK